MVVTETMDNTLVQKNLGSEFFPRWSNKQANMPLLDETCTLWTTENFPLNKITGLRYSARLKLKPPVPYAETNIVD